ncbi:hypothetical protein IFM89_009344 [Coptis chinensis]|uniref:Uncharacterized protein n=1 Tax=Coptis chinensis TaxID=261450 RepID=A0A835LR50_9MAGN|nr:hypothetical protein IFM89_009344 [Coptis chinensis]
MSTMSTLIVKASFILYESVSIRKLIRVQNCDDVYKMTGETGSWLLRSSNIKSMTRRLMFCDDFIRGDPPMSNYEPYEAANCKLMSTSLWYVERDRDCKVKRIHGMMTEKLAFGPSEFIPITRVVPEDLDDSEFGSDVDETTDSDEEFYGGRGWDTDTVKHSSGLWPAALYGKDVIIRLLDTGIWPGSSIFNDRAMTRVRERWKGNCETGTTFSPSNCNFKLIGARSFSKGLQYEGINISKDFDYDSPRYFEGYGMHTSSTAVGKSVMSAAHPAYAKGTLRGVTYIHSSYICAGCWGFT